ncbi:MAG: DNA-binding protein [Ignavibacteria bacterium CG22_combo_CG10-13_8_21_14_all_37_15]|nr:MAG: DNA-binding protein [Ignavibacteria bacterium CG22_combo_CG10-13_8_21_14_all_37_15]PIS45891.1 MAG: DNA-binding protein [Ignavibacteria bacterium CG08_land_8_20_14_0_20_37_9]
MTINEQIEYWVSTAEHDLPVAESLFEKGHYVWCLFIGHLILEKIIKAHFVKDTEQTPPKIHDLVKLASKTKLPLTQEQLEFLLRVNNFNLENRYPDYKQNLYKTLTKNYSEENFNKIKEIYFWLKSLLT